jgi:predicted GNAT family N-acyltransferase
VNVEIRIADTAALREGAFALRRRVFIEEQRVPAELEHDGEDAGAVHVVAVEADGERVVGTGRLLRQAGPSGVVGRVGRMAVEAGLRRGGTGARLLAALEAEARARALPEIELHAQCQVEGFYLRAGYQRAGEVFLEAGIEHVVMRKRL